MSETKRQCSVMVAQGWHSFHCQKPVKVEVDGKLYCATHDPEAVKRRELKSREKWEWDSKVWQTKHEALLACIAINPNNPLAVAQAIGAMKDAIICVLAQIDAGKSPVEVDCLRAALALAERKAE